MAIDELLKEKRGEILRIAALHGAHEGVDMNQVWLAVERELPPLDQLEAEIAGEPDQNEEA